MTDLESIIAKAIDEYHKDHPRLKVRKITDALLHIACALLRGQGYVLR